MVDEAHDGDNKAYEATVIVTAENRSELKKELHRMQPKAVLAVFRGKRMEFEAKTQINFC